MNYWSKPAEGHHFIPSRLLAIALGNAEYERLNGMGQ